MDDIIKTVIAVNKDLHMRAGKTLAQVGHAAQASLMSRAECFTMRGRTRIVIDIDRNPILLNWWRTKGYTKIVIGVTEKELFELKELAEKQGIYTTVIEDDGILPDPTIRHTTCIALGPDHASKLDPFTGGYKLLDL